jgi:hypothetical protein
LFPLQKHQKFHKKGGDDVERKSQDIMQREAVRRRDLKSVEEREKIGREGTAKDACNIG